MGNKVCKEYMGPTKDLQEPLNLKKCLEQLNRIYDNTKNPNLTAVSVFSFLAKKRIWQVIIHIFNFTKSGKLSLALNIVVSVYIVIAESLPPYLLTRTIGEVIRQPIDKESKDFQTLLDIKQDLENLKNQGTLKCHFNFLAEVAVLSVSYASNELNFFPFLIDIFFKKTTILQKICNTIAILSFIIIWYLGLEGLKKNPLKDTLEGIKNIINQKKDNTMHKAVNDTHQAVNTTYQAVNDTHQAVDNTYKAVGSLNDKVGSTYKAVGSLNDKVGSTYKAVGSLNDKVGSTYKAVGSLNDKVGSTYKAVGSLNDKVGSTHQAVDNTYKAVGSLNDKVDNASKAVNTTYQAVDNTYKAVGSLNDKVGSTHQAVDNTYKAVGSLNDKVGSTYKAVGSLNDKFDNASKAVNTTYQAVDNTYKAVGSLNDKVDNTYQAVGFLQDKVEVLLNGRLEELESKVIGPLKNSVEVLHNVVVLSLNKNANITREAYGFFQDSLLEVKASMKRMEDQLQNQQGNAIVKIEPKALLHKNSNIVSREVYFMPSPSQSFERMVVESGYCALEEEKNSTFNSKDGPPIPHTIVTPSNLIYENAHDNQR